MYVKSTPNNVVGPMGEAGGTLLDNYTDTAADIQYDRTIPKFHNDILSIRSTFIHENASLNASADPSNGLAGFPDHHLNTFRANAEYHFGDRYSGTFGWFNTTGTRDSTLFMPGAINGSANGSPSNRGYLF